MKKTYIISFLTICILAACTYYGAYEYSVRYFNDNQKILLAEEVQMLPSVTADTSKKDIVTDVTEYVLETYNAKDFTLKEESLPAPAELIGMDREKLLAYVDRYEKEPSADDMEKGFQSFELVSFSADKIVLRKTYKTLDLDYKYYLIEENGLITVYYMDKKTIYSYTDIRFDMLPEEIKKQISTGMYIADVPSLYDFLENYSS